MVPYDLAGGCVPKCHSIRYWNASLNDRTYPDRCCVGDYPRGCFHIRTTISCVRWINLRDLKCFKFRVARDGLGQPVERSLVNRLRAQKAFTDSCELLEHNMRTVVFESFLNQFIQDTVKHLLEIISLLTTNPLNVPTCSLSPSLLKIALSFPVLSVPLSLPSLQNRPVEMATTFLMPRSTPKGRRRA